MKHYDAERLNDGTATHIFYVDGFLRQANHTLRRLMIEAFPTIAIERKLRHTVLNFKRSFDSNEIIISTLRNPFDSMNSICGYREIDPLDINEIKLYLDHYLYLHEYLLTNKDNIIFINFNDIIKNPIKILLFLIKKYNIKEYDIEEYKSLSETPFFTERYEDGSYEHNKTSTFENGHKLNWILESDMYKEAKKIYDRISTEAIKLEDTI